MKEQTITEIKPPFKFTRKNDAATKERLSNISERFEEIKRRARISERFSEGELNAFRDCCRCTLFGPALRLDGEVLADFEDSLIDGVAEKWNIDAVTTVAKLRELSYVEEVALVEDIELFWRNVAKARENDYIQSLNNSPRNDNKL